jgi:hypothetical protein
LLWAKIGEALLLICKTRFLWYIAVVHYDVIRPIMC